MIENVPSHPIHCAHCGKAAPVWTTGKAPPGWKLAIGGATDDAVFACSNGCVGDLNNARREAGFQPWHWWHEDLPEARDSSAFELALTLANAAERYALAEDDLKESAPGAVQRWAEAKAERDWWFTTTWVILSYRPQAAC